MKKFSMIFLGKNINEGIYKIDLQRTRHLQRKISPCVCAVLCDLTVWVLHMMTSAKILATHRELFQPGGYLLSRLLYCTCYPLFSVSSCLLQLLFSWRDQPFSCCGKVQRSQLKYSNRELWCCRSLQATTEVLPWNSS